MRQGFSLVELSIVLVILGLLVGGVLSGQSLIRGAELRKYSTAVGKYQTALQSFRDKYFALPGDMTNATQFWGIAGGSGTGSACFNVATSDTKTCNGDGDGLIGIPAGATNADNWFWGERFHIWKQLANAGLIEGFYNGKSSGATSYGFVAGLNVPATTISGGYYDIYSQDLIADASHPFYFAGFDLHNPQLGGISSLTPSEAWSIDTKLDDGKPANGKIWSTKKSGPAGPCTDSDSPAAANYNLTVTDKICYFLIRLN